ncbi:MAG: tyrosine-type recombinase/integrase [Planctomycetes bacterium]|nr:tyrosine-type recombinase/integrase [Planctomycetota bacterium]
MLGAFQGVRSGAAFNSIDFDIDGSQLDLHALRCTFITELIASGVGPKSVQYLAGHKDIKKTTLAIYAQFRGGKIENAIEKLSWA